MAIPAPGSGAGRLVQRLGARAAWSSTCSTASCVKAVEYAGFADWASDEAAVVAQPRLTAPPWSVALTSSAAGPQAAREGHHPALPLTRRTGSPARRA